MKRKVYTRLIVGIVGILVLLFDGKTAARGISAGIEICLYTLIPSIFPFLIISAMLMDSILCLSPGWLRLIEKTFCMPKGAGSLFLIGILTGYPLGAKNVQQAYSNGSVSFSDAQKMCIYCNNAGPSFLFGIIGPMFPNNRWAWMLWLIQITASAITGYLLHEDTQADITAKPSGRTVSDILTASIFNMATICGWVILFRMILELLSTLLTRLPVTLRVLMTGFLELSNGCILLGEIESIPARFLIATVMLSFGGLCILLQTKSVFSKLDLLRYATGRFMQGALALMLGAICVSVSENRQSAGTWIIAAGIVIGILCLLWSQKRKIVVAFL